MTNNEIKKVVESFGATLYGIETEKAGDASIYRVLIQKIGGVDLDLCANISRVLSPLLDTNPPVRGQYYLEVSSPGIERKLTIREHFVMSIGEKIKLKATEAGKHTGALKSVEGDTITVETDNGDVKIALSDIIKAKTTFEW